MIDVLVVEDHRPLYQIVRRHIDGQEGMRVVGNAVTADQVVGMVMETQPDVVLLNLVMARERGSNTPELCGLEVAERIVTDFPGAHVLIFTAMDRPDLKQKAREI